MSKIDVIRAWKSPEYRDSLPASELAALPANPAGPMELQEEELEMAAGGITCQFWCTTDEWGCCVPWTDNGSTCKFSC
jgi:mersacidin/lichenicidin family type 2 lantibiotic